MGEGGCVGSGVPSSSAKSAAEVGIAVTELPGTMGVGAGLLVSSRQPERTVAVKSRQMPVTIRRRIERIVSRLWSIIVD